MKKNQFKSSYLCSVSLFSLIKFYSVSASYYVPLGIEDRSIPYNAFRASSKWDKNHGPSRARLNTVKQGLKTGAWSAKHNNRAQWIQVDLGRRTTITQILTQGRQDYNQWVKTYTVSYSNNGRRFTSYRARGRVRVRLLIALYATPCKISNRAKFIEERNMSVSYHNTSLESLIIFLINYL